jgi:hypothetical protein
MKLFVYRNENEPFKNNSSRVLLERLARQYDWGHLSYSKDGKPLCENGHLSVTHSHDILIIAHSTNPIGIDLEKIRPLKAELIKKFDLDPSNPILAWCQKEALIKLYDDKHYLFKTITHEHWQTIDIAKGYCCVVLSREALDTIEINELPMQ